MIVVTTISVVPRSLYVEGYLPLDTGPTYATRKEVWGWVQESKR